MSSKGTSFSDIYDYILNNLDQENMLRVERSIKENDEAEAVFHMMMLDYQHDADYINSLIGEDCEKNEKYSGTNRPKTENETLYSKDKQKNQIMKTKNYKSLPENFDEFRSVIEDLKPGIEKLMAEAGKENYEECAVKEIVEHCNKPEETAREIVKNFISGITEFDIQYKKLKDTGTFDISVMLDGKTEEEKEKIILNAIVAVKAIKKETLSEDDLEVLYKEYLGRSVNELISEFEKEVANDDYFENIVKDLADVNGNLSFEMLEQFRHLAETNTPENKQCRKFYTALALYLANYDGKVDLSVNGRGVDARTIGACAAASVELGSATAELAMGKIDLPTWAQWVKYIFAGVLIVSAIIAVSILIGLGGAALMLFLMSMFGQGIISTIVAMAISIPVVGFLVEKSFELGAWLVMKLEKPYEKAIEKMVSIVEFLSSFVKEKADVLWEKIKGLKQSVKSEAMASETADNIENDNNEEKGKDTEANSKDEDSDSLKNIAYA